MILAADVGGTKVHVALFDDAGVRGREAILPTSEMASLPAALVEFVNAGPEGPVRVAGLGVAAAVVGSRARGANVPWVIDAAEIAAQLGGIPVRMVNDLVASAYGLADVRDADLETLKDGSPVAEANRCLVSPGTGLGECTLRFGPDGYEPVGGEGGHADFAARTPEEWDLTEYLTEEWGRATWERVVSGPGLVNIFCWLRDRGHAPDDPDIAATPGDGNCAADIASAALEKRSRICEEAVRVWVGAFGAETGNVALRGLAVGGVYLAGGIPAKLLPALREHDFVAAFGAKEPQAHLLTEVPVQVVLDPETTLKGAARLARS